MKRPRCRNKRKVKKFHVKTKHRLVIVRNPRVIRAKVAGFLRAQGHGQRGVLLFCRACDSVAPHRGLRIIRVTVGSLGEFEQNCHKCGKNLNPLARPGSGQLYEMARANHNKRAA